MVLIIFHSLKMISYVHLICEPFPLLNISLSVCDEYVCMIQSLDCMCGRWHWVYIKFIFIRSLEILKETLKFLVCNSLFFARFHLI